MATKLLLIEDVEDLGRSGDIVSVRPGFARNFLLPNKFALVADRSALRMQARLQEERGKKAIQDKVEADKMASEVEGKTLTTIVKVDHDGHMYGSVSTTDIVHLMQEQAGIAIEKREIQLKHAIKEIGVHTITLKLKEGVNSSFILKIVPEEVKGGAVAHPVEG
jgi:large subunit ribosomal protein L9